MQEDVVWAVLIILATAVVCIVSACCDDIHSLHAEVHRNSVAAARTGELAAGSAAVSIGRGNPDSAEPEPEYRL